VIVAVLTKNRGIFGFDPEIVKFCPKSANSAREQGILWKSLETQSKKALDVTFWEDAENFSSNCASSTGDTLQSLLGIGQGGFPNPSTPWQKR
jgi:hypothetical protein